MNEPAASSKSRTPSAPTSDELFQTVYARLKSLARRQLGARHRSVTLQTTSLVHELYLRMNGPGELTFDQPGKFFVYASRAMRHFLTDRARAHVTRRAGGEWVRVTLTGANADLALANAEEALELDAALTRLEKADERAARVIELRYFAGLTAEQTAEVLGVALRTIVRDCEFAHAFLKTDMA